MYSQYPQPQPVYYGSRYSGCLKFILYVVSLFIPLVGLIIGAVFMTRPDPESKRLGQTCLILGVISIALICCLSVLGVLLGLGPVALLPFLESSF